MPEILYHKIRKSDKANIDILVETCMKNLPRPDFFIPFSEEDKAKFFDEAYGIRIGAYDGDKIVGLGALYIDQEELKKSKPYSALWIKRFANLAIIWCCQSTAAWEL